MPCATLEQQREYGRKWVARRRAERLRGLSCADCGSVDRLELHHLDPSTKVGHQVWSWTHERREAEIAKCVIICNACHKTRHATRPTDRQHGQQRMYDAGCRCEPCRAVQSARMRAYKAART